MAEFGRDLLGNLVEANKREWLVTNGIGGFAGGTITGMNTRRYHGILVASMRPPTERIVLVNWLEDAIVVDNQQVPLATHKYNKVLHPNGYLHLERFTTEPFPTWIYQIKDTLVEKTLVMVHGENTVAVTYKVLGNGRPVDLQIRPHLLFRDFHGNVFENPGFADNTTITGQSWSMQPFFNAPTLHMGWDRGEFIKDGYWYRDHLLTAEDQRGLPATEDDYSNGYLLIKGMTGSVTVVFSDHPVSSFNPSEIRRRQEKRREAVAHAIPANDPFLRQLLLAADQFVVDRRSTGAKTIIAGYPWFNDWGRDSLIALAGLTLVPGRFDDARGILTTFARSIHKGVVPNCFADHGTTAAYNSVDASLWLFHAAYKYVEYTDDYGFIEAELMRPLSTIVEAFSDGTEFGIGMDSNDGLISAGAPGLQLTWMDAKCDDTVFTPREGKAVEVNALWYNALKTFAMFQAKFGEEHRETENLARKVRASFRKAFANRGVEGLVDVIRPDGTADGAMRPNQIFAVSLPFAVLEPDQEKQVVDVVFRRLYTSLGLRSLSKRDPAYIGVYAGTRFERDRAYHQGTVWSYLLGPFVSAYLKVHQHSMEAMLRASRMLDPVRVHLQHDACIGSISEIFDGEPPHEAKGAFAQAWSVAEILRCYVEDIKGQRPTLMV